MGDLCLSTLTTQDNDKTGSSIWWPRGIPAKKAGSVPSEKEWSLLFINNLGPDCIPIVSEACCSLCWHSSLSAEQTRVSKEKIYCTLKTVWLALGGSSAGKGLALLTRGPEFKSQHLHKGRGMVVHAYNPSHWGLLATQLSLVSQPQVLVRDLLFKKGWENKVVGSRAVTPKDYLWPSYIPTGRHVHMHTS